MTAAGHRLIPHQCVVRQIGHGMLLRRGEPSALWGTFFTGAALPAILRGMRPTRGDLRLPVACSRQIRRRRRTSMSATEDIQGLRVIVVEDDSLICLLLEDMLSDLGCKVVGAAGDFKKAIELAQREEDIDVAILDVNLGGQLVFPVADILSKRGIPFLFATGMGADGLPPHWQGHCTVQKPMTVASLATALGRAVREQAKPG
jgi:CheY-like chemotaxis protein